MHTHFLSLSISLFAASVLAEVGTYQAFEKNSKAAIPAKLLFSRQNTCPLGTRLCDGLMCTEVCCNFGNGLGCRLGNVCDGEGCCPVIYTSCTGTPTCRNASSSSCPGASDCCKSDRPYCNEIDGKAVCQDTPGSGNTSSDPDTPTDNDDPPLSITPIGPIVTRTTPPKEASSGRGNVNTDLDGGPEIPVLPTVTRDGAPLFTFTRPAVGGGGDEDFGVGGSSGAGKVVMGFAGMWVVGVVVALVL